MLNLCFQFLRTDHLLLSTDFSKIIKIMIFYYCFCVNDRFRIFDIRIFDFFLQNILQPLNLPANFLKLNLTYLTSFYDCNFNKNISYSTRNYLTERFAS